MTSILNSVSSILSSRVSSSVDGVGALSRNPDSLEFTCRRSVFSTLVFESPGRRFVVRASETDTEKVKSQAPDKAPADGSSFNQLLGIKGASQETLNLKHQTRHPPMVQVLTSFWVSKEHHKRLSTDSCNRFTMELGGKDNGITCTTMILTKTIEEKPQTNTFPDQEAKLESVPFPIKKENQKPKPRVDQAAKYRECQKNHAALTGGHVVDGCCEFMAGGEEGTLGALKCAACSCHRSFHRKEVFVQRSSKQQELLTPAFYCSSSSYKAMQPRGIHPIGRRTSSSSEDMKKNLSYRNQNLDGRSLMMMRKKKRVRTKINEEQKEKMKEFAERLGWRMQKKDEEEIDKFCRTVNLRRQVFKVWMHNNKQAMKRNLNSTSNDLQN